MTAQCSEVTRKGTQCTRRGTWTVQRTDAKVCKTHGAELGRYGLVVTEDTPGVPATQRERAQARAAAMAPAVDYSWAAVATTPGLASATRAAIAAEEQQVREAVIGPDEHPRGPAAPLESFGVMHGAEPLDALGYYMAETEAALSSLASTLPAALDAMPLQDTSALDLIAWAQAQRRVLLELERAATVYAGQNLRVERKGTMADGRTYDLHRAVDRKAWDRDAWTRDARHAVIAEAVPQGLAVLDPATGEVRETARHLAQRVAAAVQEVHGSGPPRVTAMRHLGLNPDEYAETVPGSWTVRFTDPIPTTEA